MCQKRKQILWSGRVLIASLASQYQGVSSLCIYQRCNDDFKVTLRVTFSLTEPVHLDVKTFLKAASLALIPSFLIDDTISVALTGIYHISSYTPHEKPAASVACVHAVVPSGWNISTYFAQHLRLSLNCFSFFRRGGFAIHVAIF